MSFPKPLPEPWQTLSSTWIVESPWFSLRADECRSAAGTAISPYYVVEVPDFAHIAAITTARELVMIRQYRQGTRRIHLELPAGIIDAGEAADAAAARELLEETGYAAKALRPLAVWYANPARQTNRQHLFLAEDLSVAGAHHTDGIESLTVERVPLHRVPDLIRDGTIDSTQHVAAVLRVMMVLDRRV